MQIILEVTNVKCNELEIRNMYFYTTLYGFRDLFEAEIIWTELSENVGQDFCHAFKQHHHLETKSI